MGEKRDNIVIIIVNLFYKNRVYIYMYSQIIIMLGIFLVLFILFMNTYKTFKNAHSIKI